MSVHGNTRSPLGVVKDLSTRIPVVLFVMFSAFYALTSAGRLDSADGLVVAQTAVSLLTRGTVALPANSPAALVGVGGFGYSKYGIGQSLVEMPMALVGLTLRRLTHHAQAVEWATAFTNTFVSAAGCVLFYLLLRALRAEKRWAVALTLIYGVCTLAWPYAKTDFSEPLQAVCLLGAALAVVRWRTSGRPGWLFLSGGFLAFGVLTKPALLVVAPAFALYALAALLFADEGAAPWSARLRDRAWWWQALGTQIALWSPIAVAASITLWLNVVRFGAPFDFGYGRATADMPFTGPIPVGVFGLLVSPNSGIIFYSTPVLLGLVALRRFVRQRPFEALLVGLLTLIFLVLYGGYYYWAGLAAFGPRYLVPLLPFLLLPAVDLRLPRGASGHVTRWAAVGMGVVAALGFAEQLLGVFISFGAYSSLTCLQVPCAPILDPTQSELLYNLWLLRVSLAYNFLGYLPHVVRATYPFGTPPVGRVNWQNDLIDRMRYFWFVFLPHPKVMLVAGTAVLGGIVVVCLARLRLLVGPFAGPSGGGMEATIATSAGEAATVG
jgi:hypothetical protein